MSERNRELLDDKGKWYWANDPDQSWKNIIGKIVVGFLTDSHKNVIGLLGSRGIAAYACSHYRLLSASEITEFVYHRDDNEERVEMTNRMVDDDIAAIQKGVAVEDLTFLDSVLRGEGYTPYNHLNNFELQEEYKARHYEDV